MDYRKLGAAVIVIGVMIILVGGVRYIQNRPRPLPPVRSLYDMPNRGWTELANLERAGRQRAAQNVIGGGVLVMVIGGVILFAARPSESDQAQENEEDDPLARRRW